MITSFSEPQPGQQAGARHDDVREAVQPRQQDRPRRGRGGGRGRGSPRPGASGGGGRHRQQQQRQVRWGSSCGTKAHRDPSNCQEVAVGGGGGRGGRAGGAGAAPGQAAEPSPGRGHHRAGQLVT